ncbi:MAG TPA: AAA family ATPase [Spirochaetia bacterium]|nr:AAA family ATPase [Spirochaetia bacterium]
MIVSRLRVHPFGFFADKEVGFGTGLNVVLGPNETGKSTLFAAVRSSLLRTKLTRPQFDKYVSRYLPAAGGDTIRLELEFATSEGRWVLRRQWGPGARSELLLPSGGVLGDDEAIREKLQAVLPARQGTFQKVLMTGQAELSRTVESLRADGGRAVSDLAGLLRRTVLEAGGISVDEFRGLLAARLSQSFQHWDDRHKGPEGGRGIERPWKNQIGSILAAWYAQEKMRAELSRARAFESALDTVNGRLREVEQAAGSADSFLALHRKAQADAISRSRLEAQRRAILLEQETLHATAREWPVALTRAFAIRRRLEELEESRPRLEEESRAAKAQEDGRALREKYARVERRRAQLEEVRSIAGTIAPLPRRDLDEIRRAAAAVAALKAGVKAGRLTMTITGRSGADLLVQEDFGREERKRIVQGETVSLRAGGRIRVVSAEAEIEVRSGEAGALAAAREEAAVSESLKQLLARHGVQSPEEAEDRARLTEQHAAAIHAAESNLREELGGQSETDLAASIAALGPSRSTRSLAEVSAELARLLAEAESLRREQGTVEALLAAWQERHGTLDAVVDRLADARLGDQEISRQLQDSAPLPAGFTDTESFLRAYEQARDESKSRAEERARLADEKHELEKRSPEQSSEELASELIRAEESFQAELRRGRALARVSALSQELLGRSDTAVIAGMRSRLEPLIETMSRGRHTGVALEGSLPRGLSDASGRVLGWDLLSGGTKDMLALALRLAMASFFLKDTDGFLMLDDPLSEMDPERQEAAAAALRSFSEDKQLIVFTCHPTIAGMIGGNLICL